MAIENLMISSPIETITIPVETALTADATLATIFMPYAGRLLGAASGATIALDGTDETYNVTVKNATTLMSTVTLTVTATLTEGVNVAAAQAFSKGAKLVVALVTEGTTVSFGAGSVSLIMARTS